MTLTQKIIEEFEEKLDNYQINYFRMHEGRGYLHNEVNKENIKSFLLSSLHQIATEAIEAVRLELKTKDTEVILHKDIQGYNTAVF